MIDHEEIYRNQAEGYDLLVSREDYQDQILPALARIRELADLDVAELGAGTGRLTTMIAPLVNSLRAFDKSDHMIAFAARKLKQLRITNATLQVADNRRVGGPHALHRFTHAGPHVDYRAFVRNVNNTPV